MDRPQTRVVKATRRFALAALVGGALWGVHALSFPALMDRFERAGLSVRVASPRVTEALDTSARLPAHLVERVERTVRPGGPDIDGPGMHRISWRVRYRGGFERRVGRTQLVGPFQDLERPPCALRVLIGERLLDNAVPGRAPYTGPFARPIERALSAPRDGSLARLVAAMIERQLRGFERWPLGDFRAVERMRMSWVNSDDIPDASRRRDISRAVARTLDELDERGVQDHPERDATRPDPSGRWRPSTGILDIEFALDFEDGAVPISLAIAPQLSRHGLIFATHLDAELEFDSWFYQTLSDWLDGDAFVTDAARSELDGAFASVFGLPPPIELAPGHTLRFTYCESEPIHVVTGRYAALPLRLEYHDQRGVAPIRFGPVSRADADRHASTMDAPLAVEFELDAINGIAHALWQSGFLDAALDRAGLDQLFNDNQLVRELASVRLSPLDLALPPTIWRTPGSATRLELGVEADLDIRDRDATTPAHVFGAVGIAFRTGADAPMVADLTLDELELTCESEPGLLTPCYADLVRAMRERSDAVHGEITERFTELVGAIVLGRRLEIEDVRFQIDNARVYTLAVENQASTLVRVDLHGELGSGARDGPRRSQ